MSKDEYIKTISVCGQKIDVGIDDYGQCYFIEWDDEDGHNEDCLGAYNFNYVESIYARFDKEYKSLLRKVICKKEMTEDEVAKFKEYQKMFDDIQNERI